MFSKSKKAQSMIEYALILAVIIAGLLAARFQIQSAVETVFGKASDKIENALP